MRERFDTEAKQATVDARDRSLQSLGDAPEAIGRILDRAPAIASEILRGDTRLTQRWTHGPLHADLPATTGHVIITYYGAAQDIAWRVGKERLSSRTRPGSITLIPDKHAGHRVDIDGPVEVSHVYLTEERLQACADVLADGKHVELFVRVGFDDPTAARVMEVLSQEAMSGDASSRLFVEQAVDLLCTQLVRAHSSIGNLATPPPRRGLADWQVKRVTSYIREHLDQDISLDELAGLVSLSRFHFCTAFRLATGQTPHEWLTAMRISQARQLLAQSDLPITHIALAVGYQTPSSFAASFRKVTKQTPSAFRRGL